MRAWWALLLLSSTLAALPVGGQQAEPEPVLVLEDGAGDVRVESQGQEVPGAASGVYSALDVRSLTINEDAEEFQFVVKVEDIKDANQDPSVDGFGFDVIFTHNAREFMVSIDRFGPPQVGSFPGVSVAFRDTEEQDWSFIWFGQEASFDPATDIASALVERVLFVDADGAPPTLGRTFQDLRVVATTLFSDGQILVSDAVEVGWPARVVDDMPDEGEPLGSYAVQFGLPQTGHARLTTDQPFRASNGEETTFLYKVTARNTGEAADTFSLVLDQPASSKLDVVLPVVDVAIMPGEAVQLPVLVTTVFGHDHGGDDSFILELHSNTDPGSVGRVELGVRYLTVAQPAGHHDTVYLHSRPDPFFEDSPLKDLAGGQLYMNTLAEDPDDTGQDVPSNSVYGNADALRTTYGWTIPLSPALQMGLDFDLSGVGHLQIPVTSTLPVPDATMTAELYLGACDFCLDIGPLASMAATPPQTIDADGSVTFEGDIVPLAAGDFVEFQPGQNLLLSIKLEGTAFPGVVFNQAPRIQPGGEIKLPLFEYHDPVDELFAALGGPHMVPDLQQRFVNPGESTVFNITLHNPDATAHTYDLTVEGVNAEWATVTRRSTSAPADGATVFTVVVEVPEDAADGERCDIVLQAAPREEGAARGLIRLVAETDTEADHPDLSAKVSGGDGDKGSPGVPLPLLLLALLGLAVRMQRRR